MDLINLERWKNEQGVLLDVISNKILRIQQLMAETNSAIIELSNDHSRFWEQIEEKQCKVCGSVQGHAIDCSSLDNKTITEGKADGPSHMEKEESSTSGSARDLQREASSQIVYNETGQEHC